MARVVMQVVCMALGRACLRTCLQRGYTVLDSALLSRNSATIDLISNATGPAVESARSVLSTHSVGSSLSFCGAPAFRPMLVAPIQSFRVLHDEFQLGRSLHFERPANGVDLFGLLLPTNDDVLSLSRKSSVSSLYSHTSSCGSLLHKVASTRSQGGLSEGKQVVKEASRVRRPEFVPSLSLPSVMSGLSAGSTMTGQSFATPFSSRSGLLTPQQSGRASARSAIVKASVIPGTALTVLSPRGAFFAKRVKHAELVLAKRRDEAEKMATMVSEATVAQRAAKVQQSTAFVLAYWQASLQLRARLRADAARQRYNSAKQSFYGGIMVRCFRTR